MTKSLRSLILVATVSLTVVPALHADVMGTDPRPRPTAAAHSITRALLAVFGF